VAGIEANVKVHKVSIGPSQTISVQYIIILVLAATILYDRSLPNPGVLMDRDEAGQERMKSNFLISPYLHRCFRIQVKFENNLVSIVCSSIL